MLSSLNNVKPHKGPLPPRIVSQASRGTIDFFFSEPWQSPSSYCSDIFYCKPGVFRDNIKTTVYFCRNERESNCN